MGVLHIVLFAFTLVRMSLALQPAPPNERFPWLHSYDAHGHAPNPLSPDPLLSYTWTAQKGFNLTQLQVYRSLPIAVRAVPPDAFDNVESLLGHSPKVLIKASGTIYVDYGTERAGWVEFESPDQSISSENTLVGVSEFDGHWGGKTLTPVQYGEIYRLETNPQLYEGVRFSWLTFNLPTKNQTTGAVQDLAASWVLGRVSVVAQVKPVNYSGSFASSDSVLETMWYTGAYGARVNMLTNVFSSILMDRGDRVALQGDSHPTMAASLVSVVNYRLVRETLAYLDSVTHSVIDAGILAYPVYWSMSVNDYFAHSGDRVTFLMLAPNVSVIIESVLLAAAGNTTPGLTWMGWDDRLGNGWCGPCGQEAHLTFATLVVRATRDFAHHLEQVGLSHNASRLNDLADTVEIQLRDDPTWYSGYGVHAAANALNAHIANNSEAEALFHQQLNDSVTLCSWSPFNTYWILQGLGNLPADKLHYAVEAAVHCWGPMTQLGRGCFWELFSPEWARFMQPGDKAPTRPSFCHPWSSGVTHWLSQKVGGIHPTLPGFEQYAVLPHWRVRGPNTGVANEDSAPEWWVNSVVPTPHGPIQANVTVIGTKVTVVVDAPRSGRVAFPLRHRDHCRLQSLVLDAVEEMLPERLSGRLGLYISPLLAESVGWTRLLSAGTHSVVALFQCDEERAELLYSNNPPPYSTAVYPASVHLDNNTVGNWMNHYGQAGFMLMAPSVNVSNMTKLPPFVLNITSFHSTPVWQHLGSSSTNKSYLQDPFSPTGNRFLGVFENQACGNGCQGNVLDIVVAPPPASLESGEWSYQLSLYMIGSNAAIRAMDLSTLNPIAPEVRIVSYASGVYWVFSYNASVRLRLMPIHDTPSISAIFFDQF